MKTRADWSNQMSNRATTEILKRPEEKNEKLQQREKKQYRGQGRKHQSYHDLCGID
jgi:hypothetical protein